MLGVNYNGDPHDYPYNIYPARLGGDMLGYNRLPRLVEHIEPDIVVIFNDIWVILRYAEILEEIEYGGGIVTYFPVDGGGYMPDWVKPLYKLDKVFVYTEFAKNTLIEAGFKRKIYTIPHGIDTDIYHPIDKSIARSKLNGLTDGDFIVFNGNRNQPRKRVDITIKGFCKFAEDKPDARLYMHMALVDAGWDIISLMEREWTIKYKKDDLGHKLIITHPELSPSTAVSEEHLNLIYNSVDVGVNTSLGEGWGLVSFEHAATKVPQIVPNNSACPELFKDRGLLLPVRQPLTAIKINTEGGLVHEDDLAEALNTYYYNRELMKEHASKAYDYFQRDEFRWENIAKIWDKHLKEIYEWQR